MTDKQRDAVARVQSLLPNLLRLLDLVKPGEPATAEALADAQFHLRAAARVLADVGPRGDG